MSSFELFPKLNNDLFEESSISIDALWFKRFNSKSILDKVLFILITFPVFKVLPFLDRVIVDFSFGLGLMPVCGVLP